MKKEELSDAFNRLDEALIAEADRLRSRPKRPRLLPLAAAVCAVLLLCGLFFVQGPSLLPVKETPPAGVTIPAEEVSLSAEDNAMSLMVPFFIYQGNVYYQYKRSFIEEPVIGAHLGKATGMIDEWTKEDGYVELAGSVCGDFYEVKGYSPAFLLCMKDTTGAVQFYIRRSGMTLTYGSDLYTEWLHLPENTAAVEYESRDSYQNGSQDRCRLTDSGELLQEFLDTLNAGTFLWTKDIPAVDTDTVKSFVELTLYELYFQMADGMEFHLRLLKGGYVQFQGLTNVCVKMNSDVFDRLLSVLDSGEAGVPVEPRPYGKTMEDVRSDAVLGRYVPSCLPEWAKAYPIYILYTIDAETGAETDTEEIEIYFYDAEPGDVYLNLQIAKKYSLLSLYGQETPIDAEDWTLERAQQCMEDGYNAVIQVEDVFVCLGYSQECGIDAEQLYRILLSAIPSEG